MNKSIVGVVAVVILAISSAGCGKKTEETSAEPAPAEEGTAAAAAPANAPAASAAPGKEVLPGASSVRSAMERKDYETAVGALLALRGAATPGPQAQEYATLYDEVKFGLMDASQTDQKAATALMTLRAGTAGR